MVLSALARVVRATQACAPSVQRCLWSSPHLKSYPLRAYATGPTRVLLSDNTSDGGISSDGNASVDDLGNGVTNDLSRLAPSQFTTSFEEEHTRLAEVMSPEFDNDGWANEIANQSSRDADEVILPPPDQYHKAYVNASYNNTKITVTDADGATVTWASCGSVGFKGAKRSTSFAAQTAGQRCGHLASEKGVQAIRVLVKGLGAGRMTSIKGLQMAGLNIVSITDTTPIPHNGCRPKKARRL